jgi:hypothetical protein
MNINYINNGGSTKPAGKYLSYRVHGTQKVIYSYSFWVVGTVYMPRCHKRRQRKTPTAKVPSRNAIEDQGETDAMARS